MSGRNLVITGVGAVTPVGLSAPATCAALRAGISRLAAIEGWAVDGAWIMANDVIGGRAPLEWLSGGPREEKWPGHERFKEPLPPPEHTLIESGSARLVEMATQAMSEARAQARLANAKRHRLGLFIGLDDQENEQPIVRALCDALDLTVERARALRLGRSAALSALHVAAREIGEGRLDAAIVGGVDSWIRKERVDRLADADRLKTPRDSHGVVPGEAAAFLVIEPADEAHTRGVQAIARVRSTGDAEEATGGTDEPCQGIGLTRAIRAAIESAGGLESYPLVVCDLNGERYRALEWGLVNTRLAHRVGGFGEMWHPADCIGDCGAASGALDLVWSASALARNYAPSKSALVWGAGDGKGRGAAIVATASTN